MQPKVVAGGGAADAASQEKRGGLERAACDDDGRSPDREAAERAALRVDMESLDAGRAAVLGEHALGSTPHVELGAVLVRVAQPGTVAGVLCARLVAEAEVAGAVRRVPVRVRVANDRLEAPSELVGGVLHPLLRAV